MITPREKAILVGSMFAGAEIVKTDDGYSVGFPWTFNSWLITWIRNNINNQDRSDERTEFYHKLMEKFANRKSPGDYYEKMSPLALAIYVMATVSGGTLRAPPMPPTDADKSWYQNVWLNKWGIKACPALIPEGEDDLINLWLLLKQYILEVSPHMAPIEMMVKYPRKHKMVYLSGGQQFAKNGGVNWRALVSPMLYRRGYDIFNPAYEGAAVADQFGVNLDQLNLEDYMSAGGLFIEKDLEAIKSSDAIITFLDESALRGAGTKSEATIAVDYNIPNYFVMAKGMDPRKLPIWLAGCMRDVKYIIWEEDFATAVEEITNQLG